MKFIKAVLWSFVKAVQIMWNAKFRSDAEKLFRMLANEVPIPQCRKPEVVKTRQLVILALSKPFGLDKWCAVKWFGWELDNNFGPYHFHFGLNVVRLSDYA